MSAEVMVFDAVTEHEIGRGEHRARDRENGFLGAAAAFDPQELRAQIGVLLVCGGPRGIDQRGFEPGSALPRARRTSFAGAFIEAGAESRPRNQMTDRWEA